MEQFVATDPLIDSLEVFRWSLQTWGGTAASKAEPKHDISYLVTTHYVELYMYFAVNFVIANETTVWRRMQ